MLIGIDFDNTIVGYDGLFLRAARCAGFVSQEFNGHRKQIRNTIKTMPCGEQKWREMQALVYGKLISEAILMSGVAEFLRRCQDHGATVAIISHKTKFAYQDMEGIDLREAARNWMTTKSLFDSSMFGLEEDNVYFEDSRVEKVERIRKLECDYFIDDLEEVLCDPAFPNDVEAILFNPERQEGSSWRGTVCGSWAEITDLILG